MPTTDEIVDMAREDHALQRRGELAQLVDIVRSRQPQVVLEIGTFRGGTMRAWCECATDDALLVGVDLPGGEFGGGWAFTDDARICGRAKEGQRVVLIAGDSHSIDIEHRVNEALEGRQVDFLFIDGDHTYDGVKSDFQMYGKLLAPGGVIALHDVVPYPEVPRCQVDKFWSEFVVPRFPATQTIRTEGDYAGCGIGVVRLAAV